MSKTKPWFEEWFDSSYYHLLYGNRDQSEANHFIKNLLEYLQPNSNDHFLDLACGKGRHALEIALNGYKTTGIDLSANSIEEAKKINNALLSFHVGDMRHIHFEDNFEYIFNLFTSFGYFETVDGQKETLRSINSQLKENGTFVLDYFNTNKVEKLIREKPNREITKDGVHFKTKKRISNQFISKEINITDGDQTRTFYEHVWRLTFNNFSELLSNAGFKIQTIFGDYELNKFNTEESERLIIIAQKL